MLPGGQSYPSAHKPEHASDGNSVVFPNTPAGQSEQEVLLKTANLPRPQETGNAEVFAHENPDGHIVQAVLFETAKLPLSQTSGEEVVVEHEEPAGHTVHTVLFARA